MRRLIAQGVLVGLAMVVALAFVGQAYGLEPTAFWTVISGAVAVMGLALTGVTIAKAGAPNQAAAPADRRRGRAWGLTVSIMVLIGVVGGIAVLLAPSPRTAGANEGQARRTTDPPASTIMPTTGPAPSTPIVVPTTTSVPPVVKTTTTTATPPAPQPTSGRITDPVDSAAVAHVEIHPAGTVSGLASGHQLLLMLYIPDYPRYFPGDEVTLGTNGTWMSTIYIGGPENPAQPLTLFLIDMGPTAQQALADYWLEQQKTGNVVGFDKLKFASDVTSLDSVSITV
jgi:hypothetical protein